MSKWIFLGRRVTCNQLKLMKRQKESRRLCLRLGSKIEASLYSTEVWKFRSYTGASPQHGEWVLALSLCSALTNEHHTLKCWLGVLSSKSRHIWQWISFFPKPNLPSSSCPLETALRGSQALPWMKESHFMPNKDGEFVQRPRRTQGTEGQATRDAAGLQLYWPVSPGKSLLGIHCDGNRAPCCKESVKS